VNLDQVSKFRDQLYSGTDNELGAVLRASLLLENQQGPSSPEQGKLAFVAEIHKADKSKKKKLHMSLIWRRNISGINVRCHFSFPQK
jgi:hypothetical protein